MTVPVDNCAAQTVSPRQCFPSQTVFIVGLPQLTKTVHNSRLAQCGQPPLKNVHVINYLRSWQTAKCSETPHFASLRNVSSNYKMTTLQHTLTPQTVLDIFIEQHRLCSPLDVEADPSEVLSFTSTIDDWTNANDLLPWRQLYPVLNTEFDISATEKEWENVLTPSHQRTLKDVCELISSHSKRVDIHAVKLLGQECLSAAVFLTLKKYLQQRQIDVSNLRPSSPVTEYLEKHFGELFQQITVLANGRQLFDKLDVKLKKKGFINYINIFDKDRYTFLTGDIKTFRDLTLKIIEVNRQQDLQK